MSDPDSRNALANAAEELADLIDIAAFAVRYGRSHIAEGLLTELTESPSMLDVGKWRRQVRDELNEVAKRKDAAKREKQA